MTKRPSGGRRATEAKQRRREEAARRVAAGGELPVEVLLEAPAPAEASSWLLTRLIALGIAAECDAGLEPPQRRREAREHYAAAVKTIDTAKLRAELDELLVLLNKGQTSATPLDGGQDRAGEETARH